MALEVFNDRQQSAGWILCIIFAPTCIFATFFRFVATKRAGRKIGWEDWYALLGLVFFLPYVGYMLWMFSVVNGRAIPVFAKQEPRTFMQVIKVGVMMDGIYGLQQTFVKFSLLALYYRLFWVNTAFNYATWVIAALQGCWGIVVLLVHIFACNPIAKSWIPGMDGYCVREDIFISIYEPVNSAIDFAMAGMAIWMLSSLQTKRRTLWHLSVLFLLGGFSGIAGIIKVVEAQDSAQPNFKSVTWSLVQMSTSIICCCAPIYKSILPQAGVYSALRSWASRTFRSKESSAASRDHGSSARGGPSKFSSRSYKTQPRGINTHAHWVHLNESSERGLAWTEVEAGHRNDRSFRDGDGMDGPMVPIKSIRIEQSYDVV